MNDLRRKSFITTLLCQMLFVKQNVKKYFVNDMNDLICCTIFSLNKSILQIVKMSQHHNKRNCSSQVFVVESLRLCPDIISHCCGGKFQNPNYKDVIHK